MKRITFIKSIFLLVISHFFCLGLNAQVHAGDLVLTSQEEVNKFIFTEITDDLIIEGADIIDLAPLSMLKTVGADLKIKNNDLLTNLDGLINLISVGKNIEIANNNILVNIDGVSNLSSAQGYLKVTGNDILENLAGLQNVALVKGGLDIYNNDRIINLDGLQNLNSVGAYIKIRSNDMLSNLEGLSNIKLVESGLEISNNDVLINLKGLKNISSVGGYLKIYKNDGFINLEGLENITSIDGYMKIYDNDLLTSLKGLHNLSSVIEDLEIYDNEALKDFCALFKLINESGLLGTYSVYENSINPAQQQVIDNGPCEEEIIETGNPNLKFGVPVSSECGIWNVAVLATSFKTVGTISLKLSYNETDLKFAGIELNSAISSATVNGNISGRLALGFFGDDFTLTDNEILFTIQFIVEPDIKGTQFKLIWSKVQGDCELAGPDGDPVYNATFSDLETNVITETFPEITCPENVVLESDEGICGAIVNYISPVGTGNCSGAKTLQTAGLASGEIFPIGTTTNTFVVSDLKGNTTECSFKVTVSDTEAPEIMNCPTDIIAETGEGNNTCSQKVSWIPPKATDNCQMAFFNSSHQPGDIFPVGVTTVTYSAIDKTKVNTSTCSFDVTIVDNTPPVINTCFSPQSAIVTEGCSVALPDYVIDVIDVSDNCSANLEITQSVDAGTMIDYDGGDPYEVSITATDEAGNSTSCLTRFIVEKATLSGTMFYNSEAQFAMNNVTLILTKEVENATCVTDENGNYKFTNLCAGTYSLAVSNNNKSVGYINSTDAGAVNKWGASGGEIGYVNFLAADVSENNLFINSDDALSIQNYFVNGTSFDRENWSYWTKDFKIVNNYIPYKTRKDHPTQMKVNVGGANITNYDLYALCTGDFNGSFNPLKSSGLSYSLDVKGSLFKGENQEFEIPIRAKSSMDVAAISMILEVPSKFVKVLSVKISGSEVSPSWAVKGEELRIGWNSTSPVYINPNEDFVILKLKTTKDFSYSNSIEFNLVNNPLNELANGNFEVIQDAKLYTFKVINEPLDSNSEKNNNGLLFASYTDPINSNIKFRYSLPFDGSVNIHVYNQLGQMIFSILDANQNAGEYSIEKNFNNFKNGVYIVQLSLSNHNSAISNTIKLNVLK